MINPLLLEKCPINFKDKLTLLFVRAGFLMFILCLGLSIFAYIHSMNNNNHQNRAILHQLSDMDAELNSVAASSGNAEVKNDLHNINITVEDAKKSLDNTAKIADVNKIATQMTLIKQNIDELKKLTMANGNAKEYVDAKKLPFKLISIDVIAQQPFVSIDYQHHITPLAIGDTLAGWQIVAADYVRGEAEFKNDKDQYSKVNLQ